MSPLSESHVRSSGIVSHALRVAGPSRPGRARGVEAPRDFGSCTFGFLHGTAGGLHGRWGALAALMAAKVIFRGCHCLWRGASAAYSSAYAAYHNEMRPHCGSTEGCAVYGAPSSGSATGSPFASLAACITNTSGCNLFGTDVRSAVETVSVMTSVTRDSPSLTVTHGCSSADSKQGRESRRNRTKAGYSH